MNLEQFRDIERISKQIEGLSERRKEVYNTVHSPQLDGVRATHRSDPTQKAVEKLFAIDSKIADLIEQKAILESMALDWMYSDLNDIPPNIRRIMLLKFFSGSTWDEIGRRLGRKPSACRLALWRYFKERAKQ